MAMYKWRFVFKRYQESKEQKEGIPRNQWLPGYVRFLPKMSANHRLYTLN